jgi:cell division protein FtsL
MKRLAIVGGLIVALLAVGVYRAKLGAEETQANIDELKGQVDGVQKQISVLKAEEAYLSRPERIGPMARDRLGLGPAAPEQFTAGEMLSRRLGEEAIQLPATPEAAPAPASEPAPAGTPKPAGAAPPKAGAP